MDLQLTLEEAQIQLAEKTERVEQVRAKLAEMKTLSMGAATTYARNEAALAEAVLSGQDIGAALEDSKPQPVVGMMAAPVTPSEARRIVNGLEHVLAQALNEENQAKGAVRRAGVQELKQMMQAEREAYDRAAHELMDRWARVSVLASRLSQILGVEQQSLTWGQLRLPRAVPPKSLAPFTTGDLWHGAQEIISGPKGNQARNAIAEALKNKGID